VLLAHTTCGRDEKLEVDLAEANQVKVIRQIVKTWSNTDREGGHLLKVACGEKN
jgi:hypothetical protein